MTAMRRPMDALVERLGVVAHKTDSAIVLLHPTKKMGDAEWW